MDKNGSAGFRQNGAVVTPETGTVGFPLLVAPDGNRLLYASEGAFAGGIDGIGNVYQADRGDGGWATTAITPPSPMTHPTLLQLGRPDLFDATPDLGTTMFWIRNSPVVNPRSVLERRLPDGSLQAASLGSLGTTGTGDALYGGASTDLRHVVFASLSAIEPGAEPAAALVQHTLYERDLETGTTQIVGVLPDGSVPAGGAFLGNGGYHVPTYDNVESRHAVSADGSRVIFMSPESGDLHELYVRVDGSRTIQVSASQRAAAGDGPTVGAWFQDATADGSIIYFTSDAQLTDDDDDDAIDLYRFVVNAAGTGGTLTRMSPGLGSDGMVGMSADGQVVYFVAQGVLGGSPATAGAPNLYVDDHGTLSFVATLSPSDHVRLVDTKPRWTPTNVPDIDWAPQARVTPDGRHVLFQSFAAVTGFDAGGHAEVFRSTLGGGIDCLSCGPAPSGDARLTDPYYTPSVRLPHNLSDDGATAYFETPDPLVAQDVNGQFDVYRWHGGAVTLISGGTGPRESGFIDASSDPVDRDVFFRSYDQLGASDTDTAGDIYDARVGGGFPVPPPGTAPCRGDGCRAIVPAPPPPAGGTLTYFGAGNAKAAPHDADSEATLSVAPIKRSAVRRWARTGRLRLEVRVSDAGRLAVTAKAPLRRYHRARVVAHAVRHPHGGTTTVTLRLRHRARVALRRGHRLRTTVTVRHAAVSKPLVATVVLPSSNHKEQR
ncbi:MAG TPA: hypothetical protein VFT50_18265 [Baekduia sp.]|nr:hypothetical protein [Baekduia sp.]